MLLDTNGNCGVKLEFLGRKPVSQLPGAFIRARDAHQPDAARSVLVVTATSCCTPQTLLLAKQDMLISEDL